MKLSKTLLFTLLVYVNISPGLLLTINRSQNLDTDYQVSWSVDLTSEIINFVVTAQTTGYVGFGLSRAGGMKNADIVIGGVQDGLPYFADYHAVRNGMPDIDSSQDWTLISASENSTHTTLNFTRALNTCDKEDVSINNDTTKFIWSLGASDVITHHIKRGSSSVNILDPAPPIFDITEFQVWHIDVNTTIPARETTYWCTAHRSPYFTSKQHVVGFKVKLDNEASRIHTHHMILHHCVGTMPEDTDFYESMVGKAGGHCYFDGNMLQMMRSCEQYFYVWAAGGDPLFLPSDVGIPLSEFGQPEYFLLEVHYDNPKKLSGVQYETGLEIYTTSALRDHEAGVLSIGHEVRFTLTIPPATSDFTVVGHCSSACTKRNVPAGGINIINVLLHSHMAGRQLKLRHFREGVELPFVAQDSNYDFNYQQNRVLPEYRKVLGGDHLTYECVYDSTGREPPEAVTGGLSTRQEMCLAILMYYPRIPHLDMCGSHVREEEILMSLGIQRADINMLDPMIRAPEKYANKRYSEVVSHLVPWSDTLKKEFREIARFSNHKEVCESYHSDLYRLASQVTYPVFVPFTPADANVCEKGLII